LKKHKRLLIILSVIILMVILFAQCMDFKKEPATATTYAGAESCKQCHAKIADSYLQNPHQQTSREISDEHGLDRPLLHLAVYNFDQHLKLAVEKRGDGMYQVAYLDGKETAARRFDIVIGAGEKAYTFGTWQGNQLRQLPLSYFKAVESWANSPGFPADKIYLDRPIGKRCLECHSSFAEVTQIPDGSLKVREELKKSSVVFGIDCERCHGPAGKHVEFHIDHPQEKAGKFIAVYKQLSRQQRTDACAVCHSGTDTEVQKSIFSFKPGDDLRDYHFTATGTIARKEPDVHGNQTGLLAKSKCYIQSKTMDCNTCHQTHEDLKGSLTMYSKKCLNCHQTIKHSTATLSNAMVKTNCIDCHMPKQPSNLISFQLAGQKKTSQYYLRTHKIGIY
jgi:hypothetical protein